MENEKIDIEAMHSKNQLRLFGYDDYFESFTKLIQKKHLPHTILFRGQKGIGKSTFAYHLINYILSKNEENQYSLNDLKINEENKSYKLINENTHPNFFLIENHISNDEIKIDQIRKLLNFLNKSTYLKNLKIVMIDNAENLNRHSSNALLKALEEPMNDTYFFLIQNSSNRILDTIKSRCVEFKFFLNIDKKKIVLENIIKQYKKDINIHPIIEKFYFETPGNLLKFLLILHDSEFNIARDNLSCIFYFLDEYTKNKHLESLTFASLFIQKFYNELCINDNNLYKGSINRTKILNYIADMKKYNLDKNNIIILIKKILKNESI